MAINTYYHLLRANVIVLMLICGMSDLMSQNKNQYITLYVKQGSVIEINFYAEPNSIVQIESGKKYTIVANTAPAGHIYFNCEELKAYADTMTIYGHIYEFDCGNNDNNITYIDASHCPSLYTLVCNYNQLDSLNVQRLPLLRTLYCDYNNLTTLDLKGCHSLRHLECNNNRISSIDVSKCRYLEWMDCHYNRISVLNISQNVCLGMLDCRFNRLTDLNVKNNVLLGNLYCDGNHLESLDLSNSFYLVDLNCGNNFLTALDVSKNVNLQYLYCYHNLFAAESFDELMCILPDRSMNDKGHFCPLYGDNDTNFVIFEKNNSKNAEAKNWCICSYMSSLIVQTNGTFDCGTVNIKESDTGAVFSLYPNPASTTIHITGGSAENIFVYDVAGRLVQNIKNEGEVGLDVSSRACGMYFVRCGKHMVKFIKE